MSGDAAVSVWFGYYSTGSQMCTDLHRGAELLSTDAGSGERWAQYLNLLVLLVFIPQAVFNGFFVLVNFAVALGFNRQSPAIMAAQGVRSFVTLVVSGLAGAVVSRTNRPNDAGGRDLFLVFLTLGLIYAMIGILQSLQVIPDKRTDQESWPSAIVRLDTVLLALTVAQLPVDQSASIQPLFWAAFLLLVSAVPSWSNPSVNIVVQGLQLFAYVLLILLGQRQMPQAAFFVSSPIVLVWVRFVWIMVCVQLVYSVIVLAIDWSTQNVGLDGKPRNTRSAQDFVVSWPLAVALWLTFILILIVYLVSSPPSTAESASPAQITADAAQWSKPFRINSTSPIGRSMSIRNEFPATLRLSVAEDSIHFYPPDEHWDVPPATSKDDYFPFHPNFDLTAISLAVISQYNPDDIFDPDNPSFTSLNIRISDFHPVGNWKTSGNENWVAYLSKCRVNWRPTPVACPDICVWRSGQCLDRNNQPVRLKY